MFVPKNLDLVAEKIIATAMELITLFMNKAMNCLF